MISWQNNILWWLESPTRPWSDEQGTFMVWPRLRCLLDWGMMKDYYKGHMVTLPSMKITPLSNQYNPNNCKFADSSINKHGPWESMCLKGTNGQLQSNVPNRRRFFCLIRTVVLLIIPMGILPFYCKSCFFLFVICVMLYTANTWLCIIRAL